MKRDFSIRPLLHLTRRPKGEAGPSQKGLGTFLGVYTPTVLTILGVIMYLRLGWVVGNLGLVKTLLVVVLANGITLFTTLSFSAVAIRDRIASAHRIDMVLKKCINSKFCPNHPNLPAAAIPTGRTGPKFYGRPLLRKKAESGIGASARNVFPEGTDGSKNCTRFGRLSAILTKPAAVP